MTEFEIRLSTAIEDLTTEVTRLVEMLDGLREDVAGLEEAIQKAVRVAVARG